MHLVVQGGSRRNQHGPAQKGQRVFHLEIMNELVDFHECRRKAKCNLLARNFHELNRLSGSLFVLHLQKEAKLHSSEDNHTGERKDVQHRKVFQPSPEDLGFCHRLIPSRLLAVKNIPKHSWWSHIAQYKAKYMRVHLHVIFQLQNFQKHT